jgi:hypothetical protein
MLVFDLAIGLDSVDDILERHDLTHPEYNKLCANPTFRRELLMAKKEVSEDGVSFKRKSRMQCELYLLQMDELMNSNSVSPAVKVDIFKTLAKLGDLEPEKKSKAADVAEGATFSLQINVQQNA